MPTVELNIEFPDADHLIVRMNQSAGTASLPFVNPLTSRNLEDIRWYVETYGAHSIGGFDAEKENQDDAHASRIQKQLPVWGKSLYDALFNDSSAQGRYSTFKRITTATRLLTISALDPAILGLPWELLHDGTTFLFLENPSISIRRRVAGAEDELGALPIEAQDSLRLLFIVSRPDDTGFLDPRADPLSVMDAIEEHAPGRITWEFLRPPTLDALGKRLRDRAKPRIDIVHFDGHGIFDRRGGLPRRLKRKESRLTALGEELLKEEADRTETTVEIEGLPNTGYLLFEDANGHLDLISADKLGTNLHHHQVSLVILSACQSAAATEDVEQNASPAPAEEKPDRRKEALGSVAARLTSTGIPSVLAMTHSVLVATTKTLFGEFYRQLAQNWAIGESLDEARRYLYNNQEKFEVRRGKAYKKLVLEDWFLPALYQQGADGPLLKRPEEVTSVPTPRHLKSNLPDAPEAGFFGRKHSLWQIERDFSHETRRITISGFGGQGKTALAQEAGRWMLRTGQFEAAVFLDYSRIQAEDPLPTAISTIGTVLGVTLATPQEVEAALGQTPTLIILDNLEALSDTALQALLTAAVPWSKAGSSRVLCTTRKLDMKHPEYKNENSKLHRRILLDGLGSEDALAWSAELMRLAEFTEAQRPTREALLELYSLVRFHPLSIRVLVQQLKTRRAVALGQRLGELLQEAVAGGHKEEDTPAGLLASLELSLEKLDKSARALLPRLGVFQGGALEEILVTVSGFGEAEDNPWPALREQLEAAALIEPEVIPGVSTPFLRFHPTLAPLLWEKLEPGQKEPLRQAHQERYRALAGWLYNSDTQYPDAVRAIALRELPNLLWAVESALDVQAPEAVDFVECLNWFLRIFGLVRESERLIARAEAVAESAEEGNAWFLAQANRGEQLYGAGRIREAFQVFQGILKRLGQEPTYQRALTLSRVGRCYSAAGHPDLQLEVLSEAEVILASQDQSNDIVRQLQGTVHTERGDALTELNRFGEARHAYEKSLEMRRAQGDTRNEGVALGQLGNLAIEEGNLGEALERYQEALALFQRLREPKAEATVWHQLGIVLQEAREYGEAERHYRESARIREAQGDLSGAAGTWGQLGNLTDAQGKPEVAEGWYRQAMAAYRKLGNTESLSRTLSNLGDTLSRQPERLEEAKKFALEALEIKKTLAPAAAEIWKTYFILKEITLSQATACAAPDTKAKLEEEARKYRRQERESYRNHAGESGSTERHAPLIATMLLALSGDAQATEALEQGLPRMEQGGYTKLVPALRRILAGERDDEALTEGLDREDTLVVEVVLEKIGTTNVPADTSTSKPTGLEPV